jgi:chemotaxis protein CheX
MSLSDPSLNSATGRECWGPTLQLAMQEVFELMLNRPLKIPVVPPPAEGLDITAMVGLAGDLCGTFTLRCSARSAARMASHMLGTDPEKSGPEMWDAVGEICNMVAGNFKNKIRGLGDGCMLSVPTVIAGADYKIHSLVSDNISATFLFEGEPIVAVLKTYN